ncbi:MAG: SGNH/GDSL hydrolase family protein [Pseudomonadota bacterium]
MTRHNRVGWLLLGMALWPVGCECGEAPPPGGGPDAGSFDVRPTIVYADIEGAQQLVVVGDTLAAGGGVPIAANFVSLVLHNDDTAFPDFAGQDLETLRPGSDRFNLAVDGARVQGLLEVQAPNVPENATAVVLATGLEDFLDQAGSSAEEGAAEAAIFGALLDDVVGSLRNLSRFPVLPRVYLLTIPDASDGAGDLGELYGLGTWADARSVLTAYNAEIVEVASRQSAVVVDVRSHFLGHGAHFDDTANPNHDASDATAWLQLDLRRPNRRGHSELRRLVLDKVLGH